MCDADLCEDGGCEVESSLKRSLPDRAYHLEERAPPNRPAGAATQKEVLLAAGIKLLMTTAPYPSGAKVFEGAGATTLAMKGGFIIADTICTSLGVAYHSVGNIPTDLLTISGKSIL
jgi:chitinase